LANLEEIPTRLPAPAAHSKQDPPKALFLRQGDRHRQWPYDICNSGAALPRIGAHNDTSRVVRADNVQRLPRVRIIYGRVEERDGGEDEHEKAGLGVLAREWGIVAGK
jgi:hypothetical protein